MRATTPSIRGRTSPRLLLLARGGRTRLRKRLRRVLTFGAHFGSQLIPRDLQLGLGLLTLGRQLRLQLVAFGREISCRASLSFEFGDALAHGPCLDDAALSFRSQLADTLAVGFEFSDSLPIGFELT